ncbi:MAG TPA: PAS domain-containing protein [Beijerinckiaceae bacterium]|jgi:hypothetical protein
MKHATSRMLFAYWDALRGQRAAPERRDIDPGEIRHILADSFILETEPHGAACIRLAGTRLCALFGRELKGSPLHELWPQAGREEIRHFIEIVSDETAGVVAGLVGLTPEGATLELEMLLLPLRHSGQTHSRILGVMSPMLVPPWLGLHALDCLETASLRVIWPSGRARQEWRRIETPADKRRQFVLHQGGRVSDREPA